MPSIRMIRSCRHISNIPIHFSKRVAVVNSDLAYQNGQVNHFYDLCFDWGKSTTRSQDLAHELLKVEGVVLERRHALLSAEGLPRREQTVS
jgi:hypothetical protein